MDGPSASVSSSEESVDSGAPHSIQQLQSTKEWLQNQLFQHQAALKAAQIEDGEPQEKEKVVETVSELQKELQNQSLDKSLKDMMIKRLQFSDLLIKLLFPKSSENQPEERKETKRQIIDLIERQTKLISNIMEVHTSLQSNRQELDQMKIQNIEMKKINREKLDSLETMKQNQQGTYTSLTNNEHVLNARSQLDEVVSKVVLTRHVFQGLVLGSGINWIQDENLTELIQNLGQPLKEVLQEK